MTNLDSIFKKQRHYFANKGPSSQSYGFCSSHIWLWELDHKQGWVLKHWCFQIVVLEKTRESLGLQGDQTSQRKSTLNIHWKDWWWSSKYFGHVMQRADSLEKILMLGKTDGKRRRGQKRMWWSDSITDSMDMNLSKLQEIVEDRGACFTAVHGVAKSWTWLSD